jgi:cell wall-associated NlpC family hydrolase
VRATYVIGVVFVLLVLSCTKKQSVIVTTSNRVVKKYAEKLKVPESQLKNNDLYVFIDNWYGTKYKYGGMSKDGVDCSGFCNILYNKVYKKELPRITKDIAKRIKKVSKSNLGEGDIVVFNIAGKRNSHVGVYLVNDYFVHASTSKGVIISSLNNPYYVKAYSKGGAI